MHMDLQRLRGCEGLPGKNLPILQEVFKDSIAFFLEIL